MSISGPTFVAEHFIPVSQKMLVDHLLSEDRLSGEDKTQFKRFYDILKSLFHFEFQAIHDELKENYHSYDPDPITPPPILTNTQEAMNQFDSSFASLMERANFTPLSKADLDEAFAQETPMAVNVEVDLSDYELLHLFSRGKSRRTESAPFLYVFKKKYDLDVYDRLVMLAKFAPKKKRRKGKKSTIGAEIYADKVYLKYFKNVPVPDIEMIFPDPKIKMSLFDKLKITILLLTPLAVAGGQLASLAGGDTSDSIVIGVAVAFGGYAIKSILSYRNTVMKYIKNLTQGLYFKNLDNNSGVFDAVMGEAEEEEVKEAMLAYYFLHALGPLDEQTLDMAIEEWFRASLRLNIDFEVDDAMHKLQRLELAFENADKKWQVVPLPDALRRLDYLWDNFFDYNSVKPPEDTQNIGNESPVSTDAAQAVQLVAPMQPLQQPVQPLHMSPGGMQPLTQAGDQAGNLQQFQPPASPQSPASTPPDSKKAVSPEELMPK